MAAPEVYISIDVESDGPIPGINSMLSLGAVAFDGNGDILATFEANLHVADGAVSDPDTMDWWNTQIEAFAYVRSGCREPRAVMDEFATWVERVALSRKAVPVAVCAPAGYDFTFVYWYLMRYLGRSPFRFAVLDVRSFFAGYKGTLWTRSTRRYWPKRYHDRRVKHDHTPRADALGQGISFMRMRAEALDLDYPIWTDDDIERALAGHV